MFRYACGIKYWGGEAFMKKKVAEYRKQKIELQLAEMEAQKITQQLQEKEAEV